MGLCLKELSSLEGPQQSVTDLITFLTTSLVKMEAMAAEMVVEEVDLNKASVPPSPAVVSLKEKLNSLPPSLPSSLPPSGISSLASTPVVTSSGLSSRLDRDTLKASLPPSGISSLASTPVVTSSGLPSRLDRHTLKASLDALKEGQSQTRETKSRPFDALRTEVTNILLTALSKHLTPPSWLPLHEVNTFIFHHFVV